MGLLFKKADFRDQYFNPMITRMYDSGLMHRIFDKWRPDLKDQITLAEEALTFEHLILPLIFLSGGISLSVALFASEHLRKKCARHASLAVAN